MFPTLVKGLVIIQVLVYSLKKEREHQRANKSGKKELWKNTNGGHRFISGDHFRWPEGSINPAYSYCL